MASQFEQLKLNFSGGTGVKTRGAGGGMPSSGIYFWYWCLLFSIAKFHLARMLILANSGEEYFEKMDFEEKKCLSEKVTQKDQNRAKKDSRWTKMPPEVQRLIRHVFKPFWTKQRGWLLSLSWLKAVRGCTGL